MGNRRIGRKRLYALGKLGQTNDNAAGAGMADTIVSSTVARDGAQITTEYVIDLGSSAGALTSAATDALVIGISSSTGTHSAAYLGQITTAVNGIITDAEVVCTELPATGELDIDVVYNASATLGFSGSAGADKLVEAAGDYAFGKNVVGAGVNNAGVQTEYIYLANGDAHATPGTAAQTYTAGKLIIRLYGYALADDL